MSYEQYRRLGISEMRPVTEEEIVDGISKNSNTLEGTTISVSQEDIVNGSPKAGDMIARNPRNHNDRWLVAKKYFEENFEKITSEPRS